MTNNRFNRDMKTADLAVGQTLYSVHSSRWGDSISSIEKLTVQSILKTRLVLKREHTDDTIRYIVRDDYVTNKVEGVTSNYSDLYTVDDPELAELRNRHRLSRLLSKAKRQGEEFAKSPTIENADNARKALQAWMNEAAAQGEGK